MKKENLEKLVQETMSSLDGAEKASPAPFLLTRIRAKMANSQTEPSLWERAGMLLTKPTVAFAVLASVILMNIYIITEAVSGSTNGIAAQNTTAPTDEYSLNSATSFYDFENIQP